MELGELYTQAKLDAAKQNMQRLLLDNGYYHSTIISSGKRDANTQRIELFLSHPAPVRWQKWEK